MSRTVDIPGGQATLREAGEVRQRDRRRLEAASVMASSAIEKIQEANEEGGDPRKLNMAKLGLTREEFDSLYDMQDATILAYLEAWDLERPLPQSTDDLDELPAALYDALRTVTASDGADTLAPVDFSASPEEESPTEDSGGSETPSQAAPESTSTETSPSDGASTAIEDSSEG